MKKKVSRILFTVMVTIAMLSIATTALATLSDIPGSTQPDAIGPKVTSTINIIFTVLQVAGVAIATIMLIVLAVKYISAAPGEKATIKKQAIVYVIGAVLLFAAAGIVTLVKNYATTL